jgi:hypothetical protein
MTTARHCRHCWGDCPGGCLLDDTGPCIHNENAKMMKQLRARQLRGRAWLRVLLPGRRGGQLTSGGRIVR